MKHVDREPHKPQGITTSEETAKGVNALFAHGTQQANWA